MDVMEYRLAQARAMPEAELQLAVEALAKAYGWLHWHDNDSRRNKAGLLDLVLARAGEVLLVELKSHRGRVRPEQAEWLTALGDRGRLWRPMDLLDGTISRTLARR